MLANMMLRIEDTSSEDGKTCQWSHCPLEYPVKVTSMRRRTVSLMFLISPERLLRRELLYIGRDRFVLKWLRLLMIHQLNWK